MRNARRYDHYDTTGPKVFAGEFAAHDRPGEDGRRKNNWFSALTEAAFMTGIERNAGIVRMASYAPLLAHVDAWQWSPNLIWFNNLVSFGTPNYYVQQLFSTHKGSFVIPALMDNAVLAGQDSLYASATIDDKTNEIIIKLVNANPVERTVRFDIATRTGIDKRARVTSLTSSDWQAENTVEEPLKIAPVNKELMVTSKKFLYTAAPGSMNVIRIKRK